MLTSRSQFKPINFRRNGVMAEGAPPRCSGRLEYNHIEAFSETRLLQPQMTQKFLGQCDTAGSFRSPLRLSFAAACNPPQRLIWQFLVSDFGGLKRKPKRN